MTARSVKMQVDWRSSEQLFVSSWLTLATFVAQELEICLTLLRLQVLIVLISLFISGIYASDQTGGKRELLQPTWDLSQCVQSPGPDFHPDSCDSGAVAQYFPASACCPRVAKVIV